MYHVYFLLFDFLFEWNLIFICIKSSSSQVFYLIQSDRCIWNVDHFSVTCHHFCMIECDFFHDSFDSFDTNLISNVEFLLMIIMKLPKRFAMISFPASAKIIPSYLPALVRRLDVSIFIASSARLSPMSHIPISTRTRISGKNFLIAECSIKSICFISPKRKLSTVETMVIPISQQVKSVEFIYIFPCCWIELDNITRKKRMISDDNKKENECITSEIPDDRCFFGFLFVPYGRDFCDLIREVYLISYFFANFVRPLLFFFVFLYPAP